jgi:hypothetical protein
VFSLLGGTVTVQNLKMKGDLLKIPILAPFIQWDRDWQTSLPQVVPRVHTLGDGAQWDFRKAEVVASRWAGEEVDANPY